MTAALDAYAPDEIFGKAYDARLVRRLGGYVMPYKLQVVVALVGLLLLTITAVAPALLTKLIIDSAIAPAIAGTVSPSAAFTSLIWLGSLYLAALSARALLRYGQNMLVMVIGERAMRDLRAELFAHLELLSLSFFDHNPVGRLMTRLTNDVDALADLLTNGVVAMLGDILLLAGAGVLLVVLDVPTRARDLCVAAHRRWPDVLLPQPDAQFVRQPAHPPRAHQCLPQREPVGHGRGPALHARANHVRRV